MRAFPGVPVGLSDHSLGISVPQAAVALGACMIEKHYTVDKTLPGSPDHHLSVDPAGDEGDGRRHPHGREGARQGAEGPGAAGAGRASLRAAQRDLGGRASREGTVITRAMLTYKRPGTGISPRFLDLVVGRVARVDIPEDTTMTWEMV